jgi:uncharacterized protein
MSTALESILAGLGPIAVAVSGGVDSLTLATIAHRASAEPPLMVHAVSPAVPGEATERVRAEANREGWRLRVIEAGEFADPAYRENPVNRCFFCKTNLYGAIRRVTERQIVSGANLDDLGEYRPGLDAAREHGVRHPFVEAAFSKAMVRALARDLGLGAVAELPSAPCLSSRVETGIRIEPETLAFIHAVERLVGEDLTVTGAKSGAKRAVRCRVRATGIVVELDAQSLASLPEAAQVDLGRRIAAQAPDRLSDAPVSFAPYRTGSAFLTGGTR